MQVRRSRQDPGPRPVARTAAGPHAERSARVASAERRLAIASRLLDNLVTVPGTQRRVGVEPILGLIPGAGDLISAGIGLWLVAEAARVRLPRVVIGRMLLNTIVDFIVGLVPLLGDAFDFAFKSNTRNLALFRRYARDPGASTAEHSRVLIGAVLVFVALAWLTLAAIGWLLSWIASLA